MPDDVRVVVDANIVIAASIYYDPGRGDPVKHRIYDEASALVERLAECGNGYVVPAVRSEVIGALPRAVEYTVGTMQAGAAAAQMRSLYYRISLRSREVAEEIFGSLNAADPDPERVARRLDLVACMSESLKARYEALAARGLAAHERGGVPWGAAGGAQVPPEAPQLWRFVRKYPNRGDQRVLAEAIALLDSLPAGSRVMIASSDTGFFSPYRHPGGVSDAVTREIRERFGISCDHPEAVLRAACGPRRP